MAWLVYAYVAYLAYIGVRSVQSSAREHGPFATLMEALTSIGWPLLAIAFTSASFAARLGRGAVWLFVLALVWTIYTVWRDFRPDAMIPRLPAEQRRLTYLLTLVTCALTVVPAVLLGAMVVWRA